MKIVLISGTWYRGRNYKRIWGNIERALKRVYPDATFSREGTYFWPWETSKIRAFAHTIVQKHDTGEPVMLVGHSMGGIIACGIEPLFRYSPVLGLVTICTPHTMGNYIPWCNFYGQYFPHEQNDKIPVVSFGGYVDLLVWQWFTRHPRSVSHRNLLSDHAYILGVSARVGDAIAAEVGRCVPQAIYR